MSDRAVIATLIAIRVFVAGVFAATLCALKWSGACALWGAPYWVLAVSPFALFLVLWLIDGE